MRAFANLKDCRGTPESGVAELDRPIILWTDFQVHWRLVAAGALTKGVGRRVAEGSELAIGDQDAVRLRLINLQRL